MENSLGMLVGTLHIIHWQKKNYRLGQHISCDHKKISSSSSVYRPDLTRNTS